MLVSSGQTEYAPVIAELYRNCFNDQWSASEIRQILALPTTIAWVTEKGFLICSRVLDEMEIISIGILPAYRRMHLASNLLSDLMDYAGRQKIKKIFLEVSTLNIPAQSLYNRFGFTQPGIRKNYYKTESGPVDALCLTKVISGQEQANQKAGGNCA